MAILGSTIQSTGPNVLSSSAAIDIADDILLTLGTDGDQVLLNRSSVLNANTSLASVLIGTPVASALAANSLIISNVTASGDIAMYGNLGGNSQQFLFYDTSASTLYLSGDIGLATTKSILVGSTTDNYLTVKAFDTGAAMVEVMRWAGGADPLTIIGRDDTGVPTNAITEVLRIQAGSGSSNEAMGQGAAATFYIGNAASELEQRGYVNCRLETVTNGSEVSSMNFGIMRGGALKQPFKISGDTNIYACNDIDGSVQSLIIQRSNDASSGSKIKDSQKFVLRSAYWSGAASTTLAHTIQLIQEDDSPVVNYLKFSDATGTFMRLRNNGGTLAVNLDQDTELATAKSILAGNTTDNYIMIKAFDTGASMVEVARAAGAADPYFSTGGSQEYKFYYSGVATLGGDTTLATTKSLLAGTTTDNYILVKAFDTGNAMVEVARAAGAADPYFGTGGSQQFKFYNGGTADFGGNVTWTAKAIGLAVGTSSISAEAANRGKFYFTEGGAGVADLLYCVMKGADDNYTAVQVAIG